MVLVSYLLFFSPLLELSTFYLWKHACPGENTDKFTFIFENNFPPCISLSGLCGIRTRPCGAPKMNLVKLCCFNPAPVMIPRKPGRQCMGRNFKGPLSLTTSVLALCWRVGWESPFDYPNIDVPFSSAGVELLKTSLRRKERQAMCISVGHTRELF